MKRFAWILTNSIFVAALLARCGPPPAPNTPIAPAEADASGAAASVASGVPVLTPLREKIDVRRAGEETWMAVADPVTLSEGDTVRSSARGIALINFGDFASAELHPNTVVTLTTYDLAGPTVALDQRGGQILSRIVAGFDVAYTLDTPSAQAAANGTVFWTWVRISGGARIFATENSVLVTPGSDVVGPFNLPAGRCIDINPDGVPGADCSGDAPPPPATSGEPVLVAAGQSSVVDLSNCGDGTCDTQLGENRFSCGPDCNQPKCGNDICEPGETADSCGDDCTGVGGAICGDNICQSWSGEDYITCQSDCEAPPLVCGDGLCSDNAGEDIFSCPADCAPNGFCGDLKCQPDENIETCFEDCAPAGECGDGICDPNRLESIWLCPEDCKLSDICPNGVCDTVLGENENQCPADCGPAGGSNPCGDGVCDPSIGEDAITCPADCPTTTNPCGDGVCDASIGEDATTCAADCTANPCGDGVCDPSRGEDNTTCPADCPAKNPCGDGVCDSSIGEDGTTCPADCGTVNICGDGVCNVAAGESFATCPADCVCGDGVCDRSVGENRNSCPADCVRAADPCGDGTCDASIGEDATTCPADCSSASGAATMRVSTLPPEASACLLPAEPDSRTSLWTHLWFVLGGGGGVMAVAAGTGLLR